MTLRVVLRVVSKVPAAPNIKCVWLVSPTSGQVMVVLRKVTNNGATLTASGSEPELL